MKARVARWLLRNEPAVVWAVLIGALFFVLS